MQQFRKMDKLQIAQINKYNVIRCLMREGPINRAAIAKRLDLSIPRGCKRSPRFGGRVSARFGPVVP